MHADLHRLGGRRCRSRIQRGVNAVALVSKIRLGILLSSRWSFTMSTKYGAELLKTPPLTNFNFGFFAASASSRGDVAVFYHRASTRSRASSGAVRDAARRWNSGSARE